MNARFIHFFLTAFFMAICFGCSKNNAGDPLPNYTETGANTFAFRVNGVAYEPHISWAFPSISAFYNYTDSIWHRNYLFGIDANRVYQEENKHLTIVIHYMPCSGTYSLGNYDGSGLVGNYAEYSDDQYSAYYGTDSVHTGELTITKLDTTYHIISGKFQFKAIQSCVYRICNTVITVDGQFDIQYKPNKRVNY